MRTTDDKREPAVTLRISTSGERRVLRLTTGPPRAPSYPPWRTVVGASRCEAAFLRNGTANGNHHRGTKQAEHCTRKRFQSLRPILHLGRRWTPRQDNKRKHPAKITHEGLANLLTWISANVYGGLRKLWEGSSEPWGIGDDLPRGMSQTWTTSLQRKKINKK